MGKRDAIICISAARSACVLLALVSSVCAHAAPRRDVHCDSDNVYESHVLPPDGLDVVIAGDSHWLEVEESGQVVRFADSVPGEVDLSQPLRFGWRWRPVHAGEVVAIRRLDPGRASGSVRLSLHCAASEALDARLQWLHRAGAIAEDLDRTVPAEKFPALLTAAQGLIDSAVDDRTRAFALHMRAEALAVNGYSVDSAQAFADTKSAWLAVRDGARAQAASVGESELLYLASRYAAVVALTSPPSQVSDGDLSYFRVRLEAGRCLAQQALGQLTDAQACYQWVLAKYLSLGELPEYAATLQNYASLLRDEGDLDDAMRLGENALASVAGSDGAMVRGRIHVMLADLALRSGNINQSLIESDAALDAFAAARQGVRRWQANVYLNVARLYTQLGTYSEAYDALASAVAKLSAIDAPSRMAVATEDFADIEAATGNPRSALLWQRAAEQTYASLSMPVALDEARAGRAAFQVETGDVDDAAHAVADRTAGPEANDARWALLAADLGARRNDVKSAQAALNRLQRMTLSLNDQAHLAALQARYADRIGDPQQAQTGLFKAALRLKALAGKTGNSELRYLLGRQILPLRRTAFELALRQADATKGHSAAIDTIWKWLLISAQLPNTGAAQSRDTAEFDRAVAQDLLALNPASRTRAESAAQRKLLSIFAEQSNDGAGMQVATSIPLAALQSSLRPGQLLIAYVDGGSRAGLLSITADAVELHVAPERSMIAEATDELVALLQDPSTSVARIGASADRLSALIMQPLAGTNPPTELFELSDGSGTLGRIPWSLLSWPGASAPLVETTAVAMAEIDSAQRAGNGSGAKRLDVLISMPRNPPDRLAPLADADSEPALIGASVHSRRISVEDGTNVGIDTLAAMLARDGAWVHLSAHGSAQPNRLGYSGIWLNTTAPDQDPRFLSWLDILGMRVNSDLVVLNACQLAARGDIVAENLNFAGAMSQAGARQVVASLWQVSDAASAIWDPVFYRALDSDPNHDAAAALRMAQQRLRQSREFTHPFFWAGTQAIVRLDLSGATPSRSARSPQAR